jgi:hypothetical protein
MYSTGLSADSITLKEALLTQYKVPIEEEYSVAYTVTNALAREADLDARNSAHISVGSRVMANITLDGREVPVRKNLCEGLALAANQEGNGKDGWDGSAVIHSLADLIAILCILFPLETVFLSGTALQPDGMVQNIHRLTSQKIPQGQMPQLKFLQPEPIKDGNAVMARQVLRKILIAL